MTAPTDRQRVFLVVVDDTEEMHVALRYACRRARHTGGRVALLHVIEPADPQPFRQVAELILAEQRAQADAGVGVVVVVDEPGDDRCRGSRGELGDIDGDFRTGQRDAASHRGGQSFGDVEEGVAAGVSIFGGSSGLLDVHYFRLISGKIENVYAMTVNTSYTATGWPGGTGCMFSVRT